jgi:hypothetical protein
MEKDLPKKKQKLENVIFFWKIALQEFLLFLHSKGNPEENRCQKILI